MVLLLSRDDIRQVLSMQDAIEVVTAAHIAMARGEVEMPVRLTLRYDDRPSELEAMPAAILTDGSPALGMKLITYVGTNSARGLPAISALTMLLDPDTGFPLAIMDATVMTAIRTAAASALATRLLAREDARVLAILGAGVQARSHLEALTLVRPFEEVRVKGRSPEREAAFVAESRERYPGIDIRAASSVEEAVDGADVIATTTTSATPLLHWHMLKPGAHVNCVGSHSPDTRELATDVVVNARRVVDSRAANLKEAGDFLIAIEEGALTEADIDTEVGQVAAGLASGRGRPDEVTLYKSGGLAVQDVATARLVYTRAQERGLGVEFAF